MDDDLEASVRGTQHFAPRSSYSVLRTSCEAIPRALAKLGAQTLVCATRIKRIAESRCRASSGQSARVFVTQDLDAFATTL